MDRKQITEANRAAWNEAAPLHRSQNFARLKEDFSKSGHSCLNEVETAILTNLDVCGKDVAQLCCNNGQELLSVRNLGAARCVGFEGAEGFVGQARELAEAGGIDAEFVCTNMYDIDPVYNSSFDLVTITIGVLSWMPDLAGFFAVANRLLRPDGAFFIYEQHPILEMFHVGEAGDPVDWELSYFKRDAYVDKNGLDYYGGGTYESKPLYSYVHKISDVIMAGVDLGYAIDHFEERPEHISNTWYNVEAHEHRMPMSFTLVFRKPSNGDPDGKNRRTG
ncbi:MAG: class I SAM-dependent methyltransferase [Pseudomonadota bacterium]